MFSHLFNIHSRRWRTRYNTHLRYHWCECVRYQFHQFIHIPSMEKSFCLSINYAFNDSFLVMLLWCIKIFTVEFNFHFNFPISQKSIDWLKAMFGVIKRRQLAAHSALILPLQFRMMDELTHTNKSNCN